MSDNPFDYADEVKECPHCVSSGFIIEGTKRKGYHVTCRSCCAQGPVSIDKAGAVSGWNSRYGSSANFLRPEAGDLLSRLRKFADAVDLLDSGSRYTISMRRETKAILSEAADYISRRSTAPTGCVVAWQWSDFDGKWYTVDTARLSLVEQEDLARAIAKGREGRVRPLCADAATSPEARVIKSPYLDTGPVRIPPNGEVSHADGSVTMFRVEAGHLDEIEAKAKFLAALAGVDDHPALRRKAVVAPWRHLAETALSALQAARALSPTQKPGNGE